MPYDPTLVDPMRRELTDIGVLELRTATDVELFMSEKDGTSLIVINSVCGCAAGMARPGVRLALGNGAKPDRIATVFAGQDVDAVSKARSYLPEMPPSSPSFALFKNGNLAYFIPRHRIEGRDAVSVADDLKIAFEEHCA